MIDISDKIDKTSLVLVNHNQFVTANYLGLAADPKIHFLFVTETSWFWNEQWKKVKKLEKTQYPDDFHTYKNCLWVEIDVTLLFVNFSAANGA